MSRKFLYSAFFTLFLLLFSSYCHAANSLEVVINEISWIGTEVSYNDEWIELYNNTDQAINLDGWMLKASDGTPNITLAGILSAKGLFILERTNDDTLPKILADQIYTGALGNAGEDLKLLDNSGNLIDQVNSSNGWFSGNNETKQTMERKNSQTSGNDSNNWQTSQNPGGTPKAANSEQETVNNKQDEPTKVKTEENAEAVIPAPKEETKTYPTGILINEILPSPKGSDETEEWIEIFNQNNFDVDLSGWKISDTAGKITVYIFPEGTKISATGFLVLNRPTTKITLNNDNDTLNLIQPNGNIIDKISFEKAPTDQSYNKIQNSWAWSDSLTPGAVNVAPIEGSEKETIKEDNLNKGLTSISEVFNEDNQSEKEMTEFSKILLSALGIATFSGITILFLKKKINKKD